MWEGGLSVDKFIDFPKQCFVSSAKASPPWGRRERGFPVLHYNLTMPIKNIIPGQTVTKEKLQRDPLCLRHLPQIRRCIFHMMMQSVNRRIWGRTGGGDFYCHKAALVIEVDGDIHDLQQKEDARLEKVLREMRLRVIRFRNDEVVKNLSAVVGRIHGLVA
jgi:hypothetical protein